MNSVTEEDWLVLCMSCGCQDCWQQRAAMAIRMEIKLGIRKSPDWEKWN